MAEMYRVLQYTYGGVNVSGIDTYLSEVYRGIDQSVVKYDLLYRYSCPYSEDAVKQSFPGSEVHELLVPEQGNPLFRQAKELLGLVRFFARNRYDVVELNMTSTFMCIQAALVAKAFGVRSRILHSHVAAFSEAKPKRWLKQLFTPMLVHLGTEYWACSSEAARYLFGRKIVEDSKWTWIKNPVDVDRFVYSADNRKNARLEFGLSEHQPAVCMVGRLSPEKNHAFGIRLFQDLLRKMPSARLFIVGGGQLREQLELAIASAGLSASVDFLGQRSDLSKLYSGFDLLIAPSVSEGFPITALEAQAAGIPCLVSYAFPLESRISSRTQVLPLDVPPNVWANSAMSLLRDGRESAAKEIKDAGYTAEATGGELERSYLRIFRSLATVGGDA